MSLQQITKVIMNGRKYHFDNILFGKKMCMPQISQFNNTQDIFKNNLKQDNLNGFTYVFQANRIIGLFCCAFGS